MPRFLPWNSVEIGDLDVFAPAVPCLLVYTWYVDGQPDSTVSYLWQDDRTGAVHHELLFNAPVSYEQALDWAQEHAPTRNVERIHVKHAKSGRSAHVSKRKTADKLKTSARAEKNRSSGKRRVAKSSSSVGKGVRRKATKK